MLEAKDGGMIVGAGVWVREGFREEVMFASLGLEEWSLTGGMCQGGGREVRGHVCPPQTRTQCWGNGVDSPQNTSPPKMKGYKAPAPPPPDPGSRPPS